MTTKNSVALLVAASMGAASSVGITAVLAAKQPSHAVHALDVQITDLPDGGLGLKSTTAYGHRRPVEGAFKDLGPAVFTPSATEAQCLLGIAQNSALKAVEKKE